MIWESLRIVSIKPPDWFYAKRNNENFFLTSFGIPYTGAWNSSEQVYLGWEERPFLERDQRRIDSEKGGPENLTLEHDVLSKIQEIYERPRFSSSSSKVLCIRILCTLQRSESRVTHWKSFRGELERKLRLERNVTMFYRMELTIEISDSCL